MTARLQERVAIVTGAGRGLGRSHALTLAAHGAHVVVNDLAGPRDGAPAPADEVVAEIVAAGGSAVASRHDVADWQQTSELVELAVSSFGGLDVLVNNAGIVRDRTLARLSEDEWDAVLRVNLKGHAAPTAAAMAYWRAESKAGRQRSASVVHTSSVAGLLGYFGQPAYASAKAGIIGLSHIARLEGAAYGVRSNVISPSARTPLLVTQRDHERFEPPPGGGDAMAPEHVSSVACWLAAADCPANGQVLQVYGGRVMVFAIAPAHDVRQSRPWTLEDLDRELSGRLVEPLSTDVFFDELTRDIQAGL